MTLLSHLQRLLPGLLLCIAITVAAMVLQAAEVTLAGQPYLEALVLAIQSRRPGRRRCKWLSSVIR